MKKPATYHHGNLREALLARAVEVIGERGVEGLSLRALARDLGVSHGAPARHFKTKAALLAGVALEGYQQITAATLAAAQDAGDDPVLRLRAVARTSIRWARENKAYYSAINNPDVNRYAADELKAALWEYIATLRKATVQAHDAGYRPEQDPLSQLLVGIAATTGASMMFADTLLSSVLEPFTDESLIETIVDYIAPLED